MTRVSLVAAGVFALMLLPSRAMAAPNALQATEVAREYLEAIRAEGFAAQARYLHPEELARFQRMLLPVFEANQAEGNRALLNATFGRNASVTDARLSEPADFMRRFVRVMAVRLPEQPIGFDQLRVLGVVEEVPGMHVLVRLHTGSGESAVESLEVVSLLPDGDVWRVRLSPKLEAAARAMMPASQSLGGRTRLEPRVLPPDPDTAAGNERASDP
jgi:hypothetical protein